MKQETSERLFSRAQRRLPGGVNSPVRAFRAVKGNPVFVQRASGPYIQSADGEWFVDYIGSWGPMILGHADPDVVDAVQKTMELGASFGAPSELEVEFAELMHDLVPHMEMMRATSSGTEAVMGAIRVARGYTGRDLVVKFEGCYHGGADYLLVKAGSGLATFGVPTSAGVPESIGQTTIVLPYNDEKAVAELFATQGKDIAAVILEPVVGNMGCVPATPAFLRALQTSCKEHGALLIFDEVMTGFRVGLRGASGLYDMVPDLTCYGKIVGGGLPVGVYGGSSEIMSKVAPLGPVYQAGTLSGNPLAMAAGIATLRKISLPGFYEQLEEQSRVLVDGIRASAQKHGIPVQVQRVGSMFTIFFCENPVHSWEDAKNCDAEMFARFHQALLQNMVMWPPAQFEAAFVSIAHEATEIDRTLLAIDAAFLSLRS